MDTDIFIIFSCNRDRMIVIKEINRDNGFIVNLNGAGYWNIIRLVNATNATRTEYRY